MVDLESELRESPGPNQASHISNRDDQPHSRGIQLLLSERQRRLVLISEYLLENIVEGIQVGAISAMRSSIGPSSIAARIEDFVSGMLR